MVGVGVEVREATSDDLASLEALLQRWGADDAPDEKVVRYRERLASNVENPTHHVLVASVDGELVGYAAAQDYGPALRQERSIARMHDLWVAPTARGRGAGTALFEAVREWAQREARIGMLQWQASDVAVDFYRTLGLEALDAQAPAEPAKDFALAVHLPGRDD
ncbi:MULTISPECIES: GNAT family N-acetyltransferase [unclassified Agrococcus]|uniref:GNAT family N-acetyltransferase n=1 Tax=unclassified Agrococcus TaxID=2615065 RepID=UPI00361AA863